MINYSPSASELRSRLRAKIPRYAPTTYGLGFSARTLIGHVLCLLAISYFSSTTNYWGLGGGFIATAVIMLRYQFILHEACHGVLSNSRRLNDGIGRIAGMLCGYNFDNYRSNHSAHHRYVGTEKDTELDNFIKSDPSAGSKRLQMITKLARAGFGLDAIKLIRTAAFGGAPRGGRQTGFKVGLAVSAVLQTAALGNFASGLEFLQAVSVFVFSVVCGTFFLNRARAISEHEIDDSLVDFQNSKSHASGIFSKLISPLNFNYHFEHHVFPDVSSYYYPEINREFRVIFASDKWCRKGYVSTLRAYWQG